MQTAAGGSRAYDESRNVMATEAFDDVPWAEPVSNPAYSSCGFWPRYLSASIAAMQPYPAAVTACRYL